MAINDTDIAATLAAYLERYPDETAALFEPTKLLSLGRGHASRRTFPMHVTVGALLVRYEVEVLLVEHLAHGLLLQPGGHLEPTDTTLIDAALRELIEETGIDPTVVVPMAESPVYIEYGQVPARPDIGEPAHFHLDFGYSFATDADIGRIQQSEVSAAAWKPLAIAERLVGRRIARAVSRPPG